MGTLRAARLPDEVIADFTREPNAAEVEGHVLSKCTSISCDFGTCAVTICDCSIVSD